jgi:hypothetical protein
VVSRYVAGLAESSAAAGRDLLGAFRLTRRAAQELGAFWETAVAGGWETALADRGLTDLAGASPEAVIPALVQSWQEEDGSLEAAVARVALGLTLEKVLPSSQVFTPEVDATLLVGDFLAAALTQRLLLDLGESLEAATPDWAHLREGAAHLAAEIAGAAAPFSEAPPKAGQWQGLAGWLWVTGRLDTILQRFQSPDA